MARKLLVYIFYFSLAQLKPQSFMLINTPHSSVCGGDISNTGSGYCQLTDELLAVSNQLNLLLSSSYKTGFVVMRSNIRMRPITYL
jgi:hypothetical protein